jgi:radical SAM superfamily enzyme YgiQ (UPF0313 family)
MGAETLLIIPSTEELRWPPLNLAYLKSVLLKNDLSDGVKIIEILNKDKDSVINAIKKENPSFIGISCFTTERSIAFMIAKLAKTINSDIKVIMGGHHATFMYEQILENFPVDYIVLGEGEATFADLINNLKNGYPPSEVKGIAFKKGEKVIKTDPRPLLKDLNLLPFPDWHDLDFGDYPPYEDLKEYGKLKMAPMITSRGCPHACHYCSTSAFWGGWRFRTPSNVVDEIEILQSEYGIEYLGITDANFTVNKKRVIEICKGMIKRNIDITWLAESRVNQVNREMLKWMKKAGCHLIFYGVESGSPKILRNINKKAKTTQIRDAFKKTREAGISSFASLMVGNPGESVNTINDTIGLVRQIKPDHAAVHITGIFPGTQLYEVAKAKGMINDNHWLTDEPAPPYTELPIDMLSYFQSRINYEFINTKGRLQTLKYVIPKILANVSNPNVLYKFGREFFKEKFDIRN